MENNLDDWETHTSGKVCINKTRVKKNLAEMPDEEYINPEEKLLATFTKAPTSKPQSI